MCNCNIKIYKIYANTNLLLRKFSKCSVDVKCYLFKTSCSNLYCAPMWFDCTKTALKKLKVAYNNSLRRFMILPWRNSASEMFANLGIPSFDELLRIFVFGFRSRIIVSTNLFISSIQLVVFIHVCGFGGIICYTCFPHRMLNSLDFYYVTLHVTVIYLFHNTCKIILWQYIYYFLSFMW